MPEQGPSSLLRDHTAHGYSSTWGLNGVGAVRGGDGLLAGVGAKVGKVATEFRPEERQQLLLMPILSNRIGVRLTKRLLSTINKRKPALHASCYLSTHFIFAVFSVKLINPV